jgi:hypothetical protein
VGVDIDPNERARAVQRLVALAGLKEDAAAALVDAAVAGAVDQAFELINGSGPVPTTMTTTKADQLRFVCQRAKRILTQREVEILFRVTTTTARAIMATMLATYEEALHEHFLARMRADVKVIPSGTDNTRLTWTLRFNDAASIDIAWTEIERLGLSGVSERVTPRKIEIPQQVDGTNGKKQPTLPMLKIPGPTGR